MWARIKETFAFNILAGIFLTPGIILSGLFYTGLPENRKYDMGDLTIAGIGSIVFWSITAIVIMIFV